jgi:hypothetical protein
VKRNKPSAAFIKQKGSDRWRIELRGLKTFRETLGADVFNAFCRCFVHADRLVSMRSFGFLSMKHDGETSLSFTRNLQTMIWFSVGTLRELALAIRALRSALAKRGMLDPNSKPWQDLRALEDRWEGDCFFRAMRNIVAFHVDEEIVEKGLVAMEPEGNSVRRSRRGS